MTMTNTQADLFEMTDARWQALRKSGDRHKYQYGHAAVVSGPPGQTGAARLAARGALRIGAGVVSVVCAANAVPEHAAHLNAIMVKSYPDGTGLLSRLETIKPTAICIGPNLGLDETSQRLVSQTVHLGLPMCIDADAITLLATASTALQTSPNPQSVMTPHEGELRRFIPDAFAKTSCRVTLAQNAAEKAGCVVLFKGPDTVIASPDHAPVVVSSKPFENASWLATAGSGDVLAGFVTGLLARGFEAHEAASLAAELHLRCADQFGPGLIAEDIPEMLPKILR